MRCSKARESISDALDSRLDERRGLELSRHLDDCPDCLRHQQLLTEGQALLRRELVEPAANFDWKVQLKIQQALREKAAGPESVAGWAFWRPALASAAGVATLVLVAGGLLLSSPTGPDQRGPGDARMDLAAESTAPATPTAVQPDLRGGVRRQPLRINTMSSGFGIRTVADQSFVNRSPFPDPFENAARWRQEGAGEALEVHREVSRDGRVYFVVQRRLASDAAGLKLELHRSTLHPDSQARTAGDSQQDPDS